MALHQRIEKGTEMKITIESTGQIVKASGIDCRLWLGETEGGVKIEVLIPRIAVRNGQDTSQFEAELKEQNRPVPTGGEAFPLRMLLYPTGGEAFPLRMLL
jgi:hypothetical protein